MRLRLWLSVVIPKGWNNASEVHWRPVYLKLTFRLHWQILLHPQFNQHHKYPNSCSHFYIWLKSPEKIEIHLSNFCHFLNTLCLFKCRVTHSLLFCVIMFYNHNQEVIKQCTTYIDWNELHLSHLFANYIIFEICETS